MDRDRAARVGFVGVHFLRDGLASRALVVTLTAAAACGGDLDACPGAVVGDAEWIARTAEPECVELAAALNDAMLDLGGSGRGCNAGLELEAQGDQCAGTLATECEGVALELECDVAQSGAADCDAHVKTEGLDCELLVRVR